MPSKGHSLNVTLLSSQSEFYHWEFGGNYPALSKNFYPKIFRFLIF